MKYLFGLIALVFAFSSCTTDLEIPLPEHEQKLTLYAFLTEDQPIDVYLSRSFGLLEKIGPEDIEVKDAKVELFKNGQLVDEMRYVDTTILDTFNIITYSQGPGLPDTTIYNINIFEGARYFTRNDLEYPKAGDIYRFVVSHDTYGTVQAETKIPQPADIRNMSVRVDSLEFQDIEGYDMSWTAIKVSLNDPAGEEDYYNMIVGVDYEQTEFWNDTTITFPRRDWLWPGNEILRDPDGYTYTDNEAISDEGSDGQVLSTIFWANINGYYFGDLTTRENKQLTVKMISLTKSYGLFQKKLRDQTYNRLSGIESAFVPSEPVIIPGNVEGGYGVVGAFNVAEDYIIDLR